MMIWWWWCYDDDDVMMIWWWWCYDDDDLMPSLTWGLPDAPITAPVSNRPANTIQIHWQYNTNSLTIQYKHKHIANTIQIHCQYNTNTLSIQYKYIVNMIQIHHQYDTNSTQTPISNYSSSLSLIIHWSLSEHHHAVNNVITISPLSATLQYS